MQYRQLGKTGTRVSGLCLGMMNFNLSNLEEGVATVRAALDAGINFVDTANVYSRGESEQVLGKALAGCRDDVVIATKVHGVMKDEETNSFGNSRRHIKAQCEASLRRLGTDYIDLYQLHRPDPATPIEESLSALDDLVRAGKVHYVGFSTFPSWQTMEAIAWASSHGLASAPISEQPPYNIFDRRVELEVIPLAQKHGLAILPWSPLASGILTAKYSGGQVAEGTRLAALRFLAESPGFAAAVDKADQLAKLAGEAGLSATTLALAWLRQQPGVTAPIIGPRNRDQLAQNLACDGVVLDGELLAAIDDLAPARQAVYPLG